MKAPITPIYFVIFPNTPFFFLPSKKIRELIDQRRATAEQLLRVIMLYTLRYEQEERNELENFIGLLFKIGFDEEMVEVMFIYYIWDLFMARLTFFFSNVVVGGGIEILCRGGKQGWKFI